MYAEYLQFQKMLLFFSASCSEWKQLFYYICYNDSHLQNDDDWEIKECFIYAFLFWVKLSIEESHLLKCYLYEELCNHTNSKKINLHFYLAFSTTEREFRNFILLPKVDRPSALLSYSSQFFVISRIVLKRKLQNKSNYDKPLYKIGFC